ncbi:MAG: hypothetical protein WA958_00485 [Tunicatimonas sp.]
MGVKSLESGSAGGGIVGAYQTFEADRLGLGLSPTLGLRYRPLRWLSLFAETSLDVVYARRQSNIIQLSPGAIYLSAQNTTSDFEGKFNPLSTLVINVTF